MAPPGVKIVATNRQARRAWDWSETFEAGMVLRGSEVKSLRDSKVQLADAHARVERGEVWLHGLHVAEYRHASGVGTHDPVRPRKLLLHKGEIERISSKLDQERLSLVPLALYFKDGRAKVELALAKGKKRHDRRQDIAKRDADLEARRELARANRGRG